MAYKTVGDVATYRQLYDWDTIAELDENAAPLTLLLKKLAKEASTSEEFRWDEGSLDERWDVLSAGHTQDDGELDVTNYTRFHKYDVLLIPETGVRYLVENTPSTTAIHVLTLTSADVTATSGENVRILGPAYEEGSDKSIPQFDSVSDKYNYIQQVKTSFEVSRSVMQSEFEGGKELARLHNKKGIEHAIRLESTLWFGERSKTAAASLGELYSSDSVAGQILTTNGVINLIKSGTGAAVSAVSGGTLRETTFLSWLRDLFAYSPEKPRYIFANKIAAEAFGTGWPGGKLKMIPKDRTYGISVWQYECVHGTVYLINNRRMFDVGDGGSTKTDYSGYVVGLEMGSLKYRYLQGCDTKLQTAIQAIGAQRRMDEFYTYMGLQLTNPEKHGVLTGVTDWA